MVKKPIKIALWSLTALVVLVLIAVGIVWLRVDSIAKSTVESSGTNAFGLKTTTAGVIVSLFTGNIGIDDLGVANVEGYNGDQLMTTDRIGVGVELGSLFGDTLRVPTIEIEDLTLRIEQKGLKSNVSEWMAKMRGRAKEAPAQPGRTLRVGRVIVRNIVAEIAIALPGQELKALQVKVPEIVLEDVTPQNAKSVATEEVLRRIIPAVIAAVLEKGQGILPTDLLDSLGKDLESTLATLGQEVIGKVLKDIPQDAIKGVGDKLKGVFEKK